ncbi:MAG: efflux RND transporter periplasmic adaptor subunit [Betaproteobacteria bacterium]|nr:efflux RND transporter periplasmic adaptor subunit [Rhodocyclales bacterium]
MKQTDPPLRQHRSAIPAGRGLLLAACLALALGACSPPAQQAATAKPALPVTILEAKLSTLPFSLDAVAQTEGQREAEVRARVGGVLLKRLYHEGDAVKAGQPLFQIDRAPFEIALSQAQAQLAEQQARLAQTSREAGRLKDLLADQAVSRKEYEDMASNRSIAEAAVKAAEASVQLATLNLSYATVVAPIAGVSGRALRSEGSLVSTGSDSLLTSIVQSNPLWARFSVTDSDLAVLRKAPAAPLQLARVEAILPDGTTYPLPGRLNFEARQVDPRLATIQLRAEFDNPDGRMLPGQFLRVRLVGGERKAVLLPATAVTQGELGFFVFIVGADGTAQIRPVQTAGWHENQWVVIAGVSAGDKVIVDNLMKLRPGAPVSADIKPSPGTPAPGKS